MCVLRRSMVLGLVITGLALSAASGDVLLSSFEENLDTSLGVPWAVNLSADEVQLTTSYVTEGATEGTYALQVEHDTGWSHNFKLAGAADIIPLIANHDFLEIDTAPSPGATWRKMSVAMVGGFGGTQTVNWNITGFDLDLAQEATISLDLQATGLQQGARDLMNEDGSYWVTWLIFQGGDTSGATRITTTFDNIRFTGETILLGDVNGDSVVNGLDVDPFVDVLLTGTDDNATRIRADMNVDGEVNGLDVDPFVTAVVGGGTAAIPEPSTLALVVAGAVGILYFRKKVRR